MLQCADEFLQHLGGNLSYGISLNMNIFFGINSYKIEQ